MSSCKALFVEGELVRLYLPLLNFKAVHVTILNGMQVIVKFSNFLFFAVISPAPILLF